MLLVEAFPQQLEQLNADPARVLSELEVEKPLGTYGALVSEEGGEAAILNSSAPVESDLGGEGSEPVDLTLEEAGGAYVPQNPITEVELPASVKEPLQLEGGVEVELPASNDHNAGSLGEMNLFYPETETATDTLLAPRAGGIEVFEQLRSPESPERFSFNLNLPEGASLRPTEAGGAEVISGSGDKIEEVPPPFATDAQGATVPVAMSVEGDSLELEIPHRSREIAYPVLLDPEFINDTTSFGEWVPSLNSGYQYYLDNNGSSLDAKSRGHYYYPANTHGQWAYGAYGQTSYLAAATFSPVYFIVNGCQTAQPHGYIGLYNPGLGTYPALGLWSTWYSEGPYETGWKGGTGTKNAIIGIGTGSTGVEIGCAHELYVGGYSIQEKDPEPPTINWVNGISASWVKDLTITPRVSDPGLGVKAITLSPEGSSPEPRKQGCSGANGSRCPASWEASFGTSYFAEGERSASVSAYDPLGPDVSSHVSSSYQFTTRVDRQKPEVELEGEFTEALEEAEEEGEGRKAPALHLPVYNLKIKATDKANEGNPKTEAKARRSGVKNIKVFLEGKELKVPWNPQSCTGPEYSCPMSETFPVPLNEVQSGGVHTLKVVATDQVGNEREEKKEFEYFPATGMKDEYVMQHFPLPDGEGNEAEEEEPKRPELAVNVTNGNLVYRQRDVEITGPAVDLEVERFYNSQLPEEDNTEWGEGWTLAQTPTLELEGGKAEAPPSEAPMVRTSGALEAGVGLPTESGAAQFDKKLGALVTKEPDGGYEVADASGESGTALSFDETGKVTELTTSGAATVDYAYEGGDLSEISVEDPGAANVVPDSIEEDETLGEPALFHSANFGTAGTGQGQFTTPADVALDAQGNLWILDKGNNRVEKFGPDGQFLTSFGSYGTADGQFKSPSAIAIDPAGNIWIADKNNNRVQKFSPSGAFITKFGSYGLSNGQFWEPNGIAIGADGSVWVTDLFRLQRFNSSGQFLERVGGEGSGPGSIAKPQSVDVGPEGNVFLADVANHRVSVFDKEGDYLRQFGTEGTGPGQLSAPTEVEVDADGSVWVADSETNKVSLFSSFGDYLARFGSAGSGADQFAMDNGVGIASDAKGQIWVSDPGHNRVEEWLGGRYIPSSEPVLEGDDPAVDVEVSEGLVESVEGQEAGTISYAHSGQMLTGVDGPNGETQYEYDSSNRLSKVELPNGTWGEVKYDAYGHVASVSVSVEGAKAKTTTFQYKDEPRRTTVSSEGEPATVYDIAPDGSVLKSWNTQVPPEIENLSGSLYANRETAEPIGTGDYELLVQAFSNEGIAKIQIVANGNQLVDEKTCEKTGETTCKTVEDPWVTNTGNWPPGILQLEVIVTDSLGKTESTRFWVNIPYTPPPEPEASEPPTFEEVLRFREEFGLDLDLKGNEIAIDERIFNLIGAWYNPQTPEGEVARATDERWGVPLRAVDAAELEYREAYVAQAAFAIPQWGEANAGSTYAGYYVDQRQGGIIHVGFTGDQDSRIGELKSQGGLLAPGRIEAFPTIPTASAQSLGSIMNELPTKIQSQPGIISVLARAGINTKANTVEIFATNVVSVQTFVQQVFGSGAPIVVKGVASKPVRRELPRARPKDQKLFGGDWISGPDAYCSAGFGASEQLTKKVNNEPVYAHFALTAGHCFELGQSVSRVFRKTAGEEGKYGEVDLGVVKRAIYEESIGGRFFSDGEAIRLGSGIEGPKNVYLSSKRKPVPVKGVESFTIGSTLCTSGAYSGYHCGVATEPFLAFPDESMEYVVETTSITTEGDSGGSVWDARTGKAVGLVEGGYEATGPTWLTPLLPVPLPNGAGTAPGLLEELDASGGGSFNIARAQ